MSGGEVRRDQHIAAPVIPQGAAARARAGLDRRIEMGEFVGAQPPAGWLVAVPAGEGAQGDFLPEFLVGGCAFVAPAAPVPGQEGAMLRWCRRDPPLSLVTVTDCPHHSIQPPAPCRSTMLNWRNAT
jgi:hypothetical protein